MASDPANQPSEAPPTEADAATNLDRLAAHLKPNTLAAKLLDTWQTGSPPGSKKELLKAVDEFFAADKSDHAPTPPEN